MLGGRQASASHSAPPGRHDAFLSQYWRGACPTGCVGGGAGEALPSSGGAVAVLVTAALLLVAGAACPQVPEAGQPVALLVENFEAGMGQWRTNDGLAVGNGRPTLATIESATPGAPGKGGAQGGLIKFLPGARTWASASLPVNGAAWAAADCDRLSFQLRGDGSANALSVVLRSYTGTGRQTDTSYAHPLSLADTAWKPVVLLFDDFRTRAGEPLDRNHEALAGIRLLQFVETGTWPAQRLMVDDLRVENAAHAALEAGQAVGPVVPLEVNLGRLVGASRLQSGLCLGSNYEPILSAKATSSALQAALGALGPCPVRVRLADFTDRRQKTTDLVRLGQALDWIRAAGCTPVVCLDRPPPGAGADPAAAWQSFGALAALIAEQQSAAEGRRIYEIGDEPLQDSLEGSIEEVTGRYNEIAAQVLLADPEAEVGGPGFASCVRSQLTYFLRHARQLSFLSVHFRGTHNPATRGEALFGTAFSTVAADLGDEVPLTELRAMVGALRTDEPQVWVTELALNSSREPAGQARDGRIQTHYGAAWLAALAGTAATSVDELLWFKLVGQGWGLVDEAGGAFPAYYATRLLGQALPAGAQLTAAVRSEAWSATGLVHEQARSVLLVRDGPGLGRAAVRPAGAGPYAAARLHVLDSRAPGVSVHLTWGAPWLYTCPEHAAIVVEYPGQCPVCGTWLVAQTDGKVEYVCPLHPGASSVKPGPCATCGALRPARAPGGRAPTEFPLSLSGDGVALLELLAG